MLLYECSSDNIYTVSIRLKDNHTQIKPLRGYEFLIRLFTQQSLQNQRTQFQIF